MNCQHKWEVVREPHKAIREFVIELRCCQCEARKFVDPAGMIVTTPKGWPFVDVPPTPIEETPGYKLGQRMAEHREQMFLS